MRKDLHIPLAIVVGAFVLGLFLFFGLNFNVLRDIFDNGVNKSEANVDIGLSVAKSFVPLNYEIFEFYSENLDSDEENEILVFVQESSEYSRNRQLELGLTYSGADYFRELSAKFFVLDFYDGKWNSTVALDTGGKSPFIEAYYYKPVLEKMDNKPFVILDKGKGKWILVFSANYSFDGIAVSPGVFGYSDEDGLVLISDFDDLFGMWVIDAEDKYYFIYCNVFDGSGLFVDELDLAGNSPLVSDYYLEDKIDCDYIFDSLDSIDDWKGQIEEIFESRGITFPIKDKLVF